MENTKSQIPELNDAIYCQGIDTILNVLTFVTTRIFYNVNPSEDNLII